LQGCSHAGSPFHIFAKMPTLLARRALQRSNARVMVRPELPKTDRERETIAFQTRHLFALGSLVAAAPLTLSPSAAADSGSFHFSPATFYCGFLHTAQFALGCASRCLRPASVTPAPTFLLITRSSTGEPSDKVGTHASGLILREIPDHHRAGENGVRIC
jgi:hypothetical protein